jgi:hypothetical protein
MDIIKFIKNSGETDLSKIRSLIYKKGILSSYNTDGRMIFHTAVNNRFNQSNDWLNLTCNGLVVDVNNLKVLAIPQLNCISHIEMSTVNTYMYHDLYDIYKINEGTIINIYWWNNAWVISTSKGYDLTDKTPMSGSKTYKEMLAEILKRNYDEKELIIDRALYEKSYMIKDPLDTNETILKDLHFVEPTPEDLFYNLLDNENSYTFGFKHPSMHPFRECKSDDIYNMWFVQSVNLKTCVVNNEFKNNLNIGRQTRLTHKVKNIKELYTKLNRAYDDFDFDYINKINYGYIFKSRNFTHTREYSVILLESSLMKNLRMFCYNKNIIKNVQESNYDQYLYMIVHSYLKNTNHKKFKRMFPQYLETYKKLKKITQEIINDVKEIKMSPELSCEVECTYKNSINIYSTLVGKCDSFDRTIIKSFIRNIMWVDIYYEILNCKN